MTQASDDTGLWLMYIMSAMNAISILLQIHPQRHKHSEINT